ncbi:NAD(P)H-binding protein [Rhizobium leguminosarum]
MVGQTPARGYDVTVLVRSPETAPNLKGAKLLVGDARDEKAMRKAIMGRDAVISALGTPARSFEGVTLLSTASQASYRPSRCTAAGTTSRF